MDDIVIDMWAPIVPSREIMNHVADNFPEAQLGYLRVFQKTGARPRSLPYCRPAHGDGR